MINIARAMAPLFAPRQSQFPILICICGASIIPPEESHGKEVNSPLVLWIHKNFPANSFVATRQLPSFPNH